MIKQLLLFALLIFSISCNATKELVKESPSKREIENAGTFTGQKQPEWVSIGERSKIKELYPKKMPFNAESTGQNLNLLKRRMNATTLSAEYSRAISTAIAQSALDMVDNSDINQEVFMDSISAASKAQFSGFVKESEWWRKTVDGEGKEEYTYYVLYLIDEDVFKRNLRGSIRNASEVIDEIGDGIAKGLENNLDNVVKLYGAQ